MNFKKNNLKDLKELSLKTQDLSTIKGGVSVMAIGGNGTSKPKRPAVTMSYMGIVFGG